MSFYENMMKDKEKFIFLNSEVRKSKDILLKTRLRTLIYAKGLSECEFYNSLNFSKQVWYAISWGIWDTTISIKIKIAQALGTDSRAIWIKEN